MKSLELLQTLVKRNIPIGLKEGRLYIGARPDELGSELLAALRQQRDELEAYFRAQAASPDRISALPREGDSFPLSYAQQRLWMVDQLGNGSAQCHMPTLLRLTGQLRTDLLQTALAHVVARHEILRTVYRSQGDDVVQQVLPPLCPLLYQIDLQGRPDQATDVAEQVVAQPFDLSCEPPLRVTLIQPAADQYLLVLVLHHIASDGWSSAILVDECCSTYAALSVDETPSLPLLEIQYLDYAQWQRQPEQVRRFDTQLDYWRQQLNGIPDVHNLPLDHPRPPQQQFAGRVYRAQLDGATTLALRAACQAQGATLFMGLFALFSALLSRYSGETDIVIGTPIANREQPEIANLIGFFVNTLALRADFSTQPSFSALLAQCKQTTLAAYAHQQLPFDRLVEALRPQRTLAYSPLFQVMLSLQNNADAAVELPGLRIEPVEAHHTTAQFDLSLDIHEEHDTLDLAWEYSTDLFEHDTIVRLNASFACLLQAALAAPDSPVDRLPLLAASERQQLSRFAGDAAIVEVTELLPARFGRLAAQYPDLPAVVDADQQLSHAELEAQSNRLAHYLLQQGVQAEQFVAFCVTRSILLPVVTLGILKAGAAYIPLTPE
ncbi:condensation domain-containing protein, partial [Chitinivorax sp. B]|uniref:condensation domain-containing protein n=1 Tax=Chitinivorax sp. B TaxID=2502235 RepID=UPI001484D315